MIFNSVHCGSISVVFSLQLGWISEAKARTGGLDCTPATLKSVNMQDRSREIRLSLRVVGPSANWTKSLLK